MNPKSSPKINVLLAEDHTIVREGLCSLLDADGAFLIVGQARNGREAVELAASLQPDVVLMDIAMPILNGLEATRRICTTDPKAKIIILSAHSDDAYIERMIAAGAAGFVQKQTSYEILITAIIEVAKGNTYFSPYVGERMKAANESRDREGMSTPGVNRLTPRESEVLQLVAKGYANKQVAIELGICLKTAEKHREHLMAKLSIHDTAGLTRYAIGAGVIESSVQLTIV